MSVEIGAKDQFLQLFHNWTIFPGILAASLFLLVVSIFADVPGDVGWLILFNWGAIWLFSILGWYMFGSFIVWIGNKTTNDANAKSSKVSREIKYLSAGAVIAYILVQTLKIPDDILTIFVLAFVVEFVRAIYAIIYDRTHRNNMKQDVNTTGFLPPQG